VGAEGEGCGAVRWNRSNYVHCRTVFKPGGINWTTPTTRSAGSVEGMTRPANMSCTRGGYWGGYGCGALLGTRLMDVNERWVKKMKDPDGDYVYPTL